MPGITVRSRRDPGGGGPFHCWACCQSCAIDSLSGNRLFSEIAPIMGRFIPALLLSAVSSPVWAVSSPSTALTPPAGASRVVAPAHDRFAQWEKEIGAFERSDALKPPPANAIEFLGSSTIRFWKLERWFPGTSVFNRGFGGSEIEDSTHFAPRIALKYHPRLIVFYAGDNDINSRKTPRRVLSDFQAFSREIHRSLPRTKILFLSIKPSLARISQIPAQQEANHLVARYCEGKPWLRFLDMSDLMLNSAGKPRPELFRPDGLHMNDAGYALWSARLKSRLQ